MNKNTRMIDDILIDEQIRYVHPESTHGEQWDMVRQDMSQWALQTGFSVMDDFQYKDIVKDYAEARGWTQEGFTGMEIIR